MAMLLLVRENEKEYVVICDEFGDGDDFDDERFGEEYGSDASIIAEAFVDGDVNSFPVNRCLTESY